MIYRTIMRHIKEMDGVGNGIRPWIILW